MKAKQILFYIAYKPPFCDFLSFCSGFFHDHSLCILLASFLQGSQCFSNTGIERTEWTLGEGQERLWVFTTACKLEWMGWDFAFFPSFSLQSILSCLPACYSVNFILHTSKSSSGSSCCHLPACLYRYPPCAIKYPCLVNLPLSCAPFLQTQCMQCCINVSNLSYQVSHRC